KILDDHNCKRDSQEECQIFFGVLPNLLPVNLHTARIVKEEKQADCESGEQRRDDPLNDLFSCVHSSYRFDRLRLQALFFTMFPPFPAFLYYTINTRRKISE